MGGLRGSGFFSSLGGIKEGDEDEEDVEEEQDLDDMSDASSLNEEDVAAMNFHMPATDDLRAIAKFFAAFGTPGGGADKL